MDIRRVFRRKQGDDGAGGLAHDLCDQLERVFGREAEAHQRDIRAFSRSDCANLLHVNLTGDHLVAEPSHDLG